MAIRERPDGRWQAVVSVRVDGKVVRHTKLAPKGAGKREAKRLEDEIRGELAARRKSATAERRSTVIELVDRWLEMHASTVRASSAAEYRRRVDRWIRPHPIAQVRLDKLTAQHVDAHYARLRSAGLGARSLQAAHALLDQALDNAVRWELMPRNPAAGVKFKRPRDVVVVPEERVTLAAAKAAHLQSPEWGLWLHLLIVTGARRGEISALRWSDVDIKTGTLTIERSAVPKLDDQPPKNGQARTVILDAVTVELLRAAWDVAAINAAELGDAHPERRWLFTGDPEGRRRRPYDWPTWQWTKMRELVPELRTVKMHHLRHRAATMLIAAGIPVTVAADRLGHSPQTLLRTYAHPTADLGSAAASVTALN